MDTFFLCTPGSDYVSPWRMVVSHAFFSTSLTPKQKPAGIYSKPCGFNSESARNPSKAFARCRADLPDFDELLDLVFRQIGDYNFGSMTNSTRLAAA
jgi:hypothetical protein